jgi:hypothetical protein
MDFPLSADGGSLPDPAAAMHFFAKARSRFRRNNIEVL